MCAGDEVEQRLMSTPARPGSDVDAAKRRTSSGLASASATAVILPSDIPQTSSASGACSTTASAKSGHHRPRVVGVIVAPVGPAEARQIDAHHRYVQRERHDVPCVRVLRAAVKEDNLGILAAPTNGADAPPVCVVVSTRPTTGLPFQGTA